MFSIKYFFSKCGQIPSFLEKFTFFWNDNLKKLISILGESNSKILYSETATGDVL